MNLLLFLLVSFLSFNAQPVLYKGRIRPIAALASETRPEEMQLFPLASDPTVWLSLKELQAKKLNYNPTLFEDAAFENLLHIKGDSQEEMAKKIQTAFAPLLGREVEGLSFPTEAQLLLEMIYLKLPWMPILLIFYSAAALAFFWMPTFANRCFITAFTLHTLCLITRCVILERPPVSNMEETLLYVPWVSAALTLSLGSRAFFFGALASSLLLAVTFVTGMSPRLETVQPVLNSQLWLSTHVLMVVGSYGLFFIAALVGHAILLAPNSPETEGRVSFLLLSLYLGTAFLIGGTLLGGVWASQSWGRFWDWDPKESWAFISSLCYLIVVHLYRFKKVGVLGLALGSSLAFLSITFTWYGVNYVLGTGLHSYGFGSGNSFFYFAFLVLDASFLTRIYYRAKRSLKNERGGC